MDPKQMASLMKQMGIKNEEVAAERVVIEKADGSKIIVESPSVQAIEMQGQKSFQIAGKIVEAEASESQEKSDVDIIMEECNCTRQEAEAALEKAKGDLAEAILSLKGA
ncbi:MAG: nascent polypeptide-associated complex protein [Candidatus Norongarragalinales archaeon]